MNKTKIEWVKNPDGSQGYTWNPITGCLNGCSYCYARKLANGRLKPLYLANENVIPIGRWVRENCGDARQLEAMQYDRQADPFYPRFWTERVREEFGAWSSGAEPKGIFVCDMSDLFGVGIPEEWTRRILSHIGMSWYREHRFYLLTKQPQNLIKFSPFPDNCWVGVTATDPRMFVEALDEIYDVKAKVKFISLEPLLEWCIEPGVLLKDLTAQQLDWLIIGAQTKPTVYPKIEWVEEIVRACDKAGVPVFLKDNLKPILPPFGNELFPPAIRVRQEIPK